MAQKVKDSLSQFLKPEEAAAVKHFNLEVMSFHFDGTVQAARERALKAMGADVCYLAKAFEALWPHWFLNGRREMAAGNMKQARAVCSEILDKLRVDVTRGFYASPLAGLNNISGMVLTGKNRAAVERVGTGRGVRVVKMCFYHPEKHASASKERELCQMCYQRDRRLREAGLLNDDTPLKVEREMMNLPKHSRIVPHAQQVLEAYGEEFEGAGRIQ